MRIYVDFSVFTESQAVGNVHGHLEFRALPRQGELVSFERPKEGVTPIRVKGFSYQLSVEQVIHTPGDGQCSLSLADVVLGSRDDAKRLFAYLEQGFGVHADEYDVKQ